MTRAGGSDVSKAFHKKWYFYAEVKSQKRSHNASDGGG